MDKAQSIYDAIEAKYQEIYSLRKRFEGDFKKIISDILSSEGYEFILLSVRTKEVFSFVAKANRPKQNGKGKKYKDPFNQITDMTGVRVIVQYKDKARKIDKLLRCKLNVDEINSKDTIAESNPKEFSYPSIQIIAKITDELAVEYDCQCIKDWKIEIQVRTILEHAWCELSRSIFYNRDVPDEHVRDLSELSARIERTDKDFIELREKVGQLIGKDKTTNKVDQPIGKDKVTKSEVKQNISTSEIIDMLNKSNIVKDIRNKLAKQGLTASTSARNDYAERISSILRRQGAESRQDAEDKMNAKIDLIVDACVLHMTATNMTSYPTDSLLEAALAIVDNGEITAEEYSKEWSDRWKDGFRKASKEYDEKHKR